MMAREGSPASNAPGPLDESLVEILEAIREPALLYLPGGRIAAVNRAAAALTEFTTVGMNIGDLLERYGASRSDGSPIICSDLPYNRALRGEIVTQGERIQMTLPGGRVFRVVVTSTPIFADGKVVAALSVWRDFEAYVHGLAVPPTPKDAADGK